MDIVEIKYTAKEAMQLVVEYLNSETVRAIQVISIRTISESERKLFVKLVAHWLHKNRKSVFVLADSIASLQIVKQRIETKYKGIRIIETATLEEHGVSDDMILNRINGAEADCIIVWLPQDVEQPFIEQNRLSLNAKVWIGLGSRREWLKEKSLFEKIKESFLGATQKKR